MSLADRMRAEREKARKPKPAAKQKPAAKPAAKPAPVPIPEPADIEIPADMQEEMDAVPRGNIDLDRVLVFLATGKSHRGKRPRWIRAKLREDPAMFLRVLTRLIAYLRGPES